MSARVAVAALVCDGPCCVDVGLEPTTCEASAPIRGDGPVELEQAHRAARLKAVLLAESLGWDVSASGRPVMDLCPRCKAVVK